MAARHVNYLVGDVGGTNSRLSLISLSLDSPQHFPSLADEEILGEKVFPSGKFESLEEIIQTFLEEIQNHSSQTVKRTIDCCCLAVAGPINGNRVKITNLPWTIDSVEVERRLGIGKVLLINDFAGIAYGLNSLSGDQLFQLQKPKVVKPGPWPIACLGAGTGLGEVFLTPSPGDDEFSYEVFSSEGGHADFAPRNRLEFHLLEEVARQHNCDRVSVERLVSGPGIPSIFSALSKLQPELANKEFSRRLAMASAANEDLGALISQAAESSICPLAVKTIDIFIQLYGAEAGNLAIKLLPFSGLYIAGGIAPKLLWAFQRNEGQFMENFLQKGRMRSLLENVPVFVVLEKNVGLLGARVKCRKEIRKQLQNNPKQGKLRGKL